MGKLLDGFSDDHSLVFEGNDSLGKRLNDCLLSGSQVSWLGLTLSNNVFLLLVSGNQFFGELSFSLSEDSFLLGILSLVFNNIEFLKCHSSLCLGDGDLLYESQSSFVNRFGSFKLFFSSIDSGSGFFSVLKIGLSLSEC